MMNIDRPATAAQVAEWARSEIEGFDFLAPAKQAKPQIAPTWVDNVGAITSATSAKRVVIDCHVL